MQVEDLLFHEIYNSLLQFVLMHVSKKSKKNTIEQTLSSLENLYIRNEKKVFKDSLDIYKPSVSRLQTLHPYAHLPKEVLLATMVAVYYLFPNQVYLCL